MVLSLSTPNTFTSRSRSDPPLAIYRYPPLAIIYYDYYDPTTGVLNGSSYPSHRASRRERVRLTQQPVVGHALRSSQRDRVDLGQQLESRLESSSSAERRAQLEQRGVELRGGLPHVAALPIRESDRNYSHQDGGTSVLLHHPLVLSKLLRVRTWQLFQQLSSTK